MKKKLRDELDRFIEHKRFGILITRPGTQAGVMVGPFNNREAASAWLDSMADRYPHAIAEASVDVANLLTADELDAMLAIGEAATREPPIQ